jgi:GT2 family glycosyltransferase
MRDDGAVLPRFSQARDDDVSVIVVSYNTAHLLERCIGALRCASSGLSVSLVIVDNASRDDSVALIRSRIDDCTLIENAVNVGFGRANNQALAHCGGRHVLLLNADAYLYPDTLRRCLLHMKADPACGVLGVQPVGEAGQLEAAARLFPTPWQTFVLHSGLFGGTARAPAAPRLTAGGALVAECDWVVGCFYLIRRQVIEQVGLFDPRYFLYFEEVDHCHAVKQAGWKVECLLDARVVHEGGASAASDGALGPGRQISAIQAESSLLYFRKHGGIRGVLAAIALSVLTDGVLAGKWLLRRRTLAGLAPYWQNTTRICRLALQTRLGRQPTR